MSTTETPLIELDDVKVTFTSRTGTIFRPNRVHAVRGVSLLLHRGETVGIVGESGCGKSTTANILCGLQTPTSGTLRVGGEQVTRTSPAVRRRIGRVVSVVFQDPSSALNPRMLVREQLTDPLRIHGIGSAAQRLRKVQDLMPQVGLPASALDALPSQLSGGQRQRVAIARALVLDPEVIIADEPTSALDVSVRAQILNLFMDLKRELGLSMVFISHDIQTIRYISDRIAVMNKGKIVEEGPSETILNNPRDAYTRTLLAASPSLLRPPSVRTP
ncbi:ABC transporter ATP-binding protein [Nesterenkonia haasae]|uniref:ABC transporter ATP-binding protein n=1 Tax=Nesterenkonia haasae TaxID=2587813 RepID=UPI0013918E8B|nr:ATP-binding cassette domain-containing protein [Nesterenkonia haasae]NDK31686.1 ABC transporter ATP-binding protein [Nesterenkonia haasae]